MKFKISKFFASLKVLSRAKESRLVSALLLREALVLSLVALGIFLSFESILPGTVSLRTGILFFIVGISLILLAEQAVSRTIPESNNHPLEYSPRKKRFILGFFFLWTLFLIGNSLFGFHIGIIAILLLVTLPLLWIFFTIMSGKRN